MPDAFAGTFRGDSYQAGFSNFAQTKAQYSHVERTFVLDLTPPLDELRKGLDQKWRNQLNRAEKNGLTITEGHEMDLFSQFVDLYTEMWQRKKFKEGVDINEFARIQRALPASKRMKVLICSSENKPVAGCVCSSVGLSGNYLLGATSDEGLRTKGSYLLQWRIIMWLKQLGCLYYDLGEIDPDRNPGVYHFKRGLSGRDHTRIGSLEACENLLSSWCAKAVDIARARNWRG